MLYLKILAVILTVAILIGKQFNISFSNDALDRLIALTAFACVGSCLLQFLLKVLSKNGWIILSILIFICAICYITICFFTFQFPFGHQPRNFKQDNDFIVKAYTARIGFMDTGTVYELYQNLENSPFLEKYIGHASNSHIDYNYYKGIPVLFENKKIIVSYKNFKKEEKSDTLRIIFGKKSEDL